MRRDAECMKGDGMRGIVMKLISQRMRRLGAEDARAGKPIEAFYDIPKIRHTEGLRAEYEIGYRAEKREMGTTA